MPLKPLPPVLASHLLREVDEALIDLLRGLEPGDWDRPALGDWAVRDLAAHLLDGALRRLSLDRDRHRPPIPNRDLSNYDELVRYLNDLNASWVEASLRLSPAVLVDLLQWACPQVADYFDTLEPEGEAAFPVSWAGEDISRVWMDVAREFTERWHHQQQIRDAVGAKALDQERYVRPLLETLMRALSRSYAAVEAPVGVRVEIRISDLEDAAWTLAREEGAWLLASFDPTGEAQTSIVLPAETAWRLLTKGVSSAKAKESATVSGESRWADAFFETVAVMA